MLAERCCGRGLPEVFVCGCQTRNNSVFASSLSRKKSLQAVLEPLTCKGVVENGRVLHCAIVHKFSKLANVVAIPMVIPSML